MNSDMAFREGDCVRMRSSKPLIPTYVAIIEEMKVDSRDVCVRWYYWPEETKKGRRHFHGSKELILSDHFDVQSVDTIEGKCTVHSLKNYMKLDVVGDDDFFCRFNYNSSTGALTPDIVQVYCKCEMPYNPDEVMVQCDHCTDWFHPACIDMTVEEAERIDNFSCESCSLEVQKKLRGSHSATRLPDANVDTKRRQR